MLSGIDPYDHGLIFNYNRITCNIATVKYVSDYVSEAWGNVNSFSC